jgi:predicted transcriptional regulator
MQRTQIFLTEAEQAGLQSLAKARGSTVSAVIREAVDQYLQGTRSADWRNRRLAAFGLWSDRPAPDLDALRREERFGDWND